MWENLNQNNSEYAHFSRNGIPLLFLKEFSADFLNFRNTYFLENLLKTGCVIFLHYSE